MYESIYNVESNTNWETLVTVSTDGGVGRSVAPFSLLSSLTLSLLFPQVVMAKVVVSEQGKGFRLLYPSDFSNIMSKVSRSGVPFI